MSRVVVCGGACLFVATKELLFLTETEFLLGLLSSFSCQLIFQLLAIGMSADIGRGTETEAVSLPRIVPIQTETSVFSKC